ncbi:hypothetical protein LguiB_026702 [Lonicera macranthoides]
MSDIPQDEQWLPLNQILVESKKLDNLPHQQKQPMAESENLNNSPREQKPPHRKCPRCESKNTKFLYYNNYSHSQPRYFCKECRRSWTQGGTLRHVPVGGNHRKGKPTKPLPSSQSNGYDSHSQSSPPQILQVPQNGNVTNKEFANLGMVATNPIYSGIKEGYLSCLTATQGLHYPLINRQFCCIGTSNYGILEGFNNHVANFRPQEQMLHQENEEVYQMGDEMGNWIDSLINNGLGSIGSGSDGSGLDPSQWANDLNGYRPPLDP